MSAQGKSVPSPKAGWEALSGGEGCMVSRSRRRMVGKGTRSCAIVTLRKKLDQPRGQLSLRGTYLVPPTFSLPVALGREPLDTKPTAWWKGGE